MTRDEFWQALRALRQEGNDYEALRLLRQLSLEALFLGEPAIAQVLATLAVSQGQDEVLTEISTALDRLER